jgi:hypothetical protein
MRVLCTRISSSSISKTGQAINMAVLAAEGAVDALPPNTENGVHSIADHAAEQDHPDGAEIRRQVSVVLL